MQRKYLLLGLIPVLVIAAAAAYHRSQRNAELARQQVVKDNGEVAVTLVRVESRTFRPTIPFTGNLLAVNRADLRAEVAGRVTRVLVQEGDTVAAGALLSTQDEDDLALALRAAEAQATQAKSDRDRAETLLAKKSITKQAAQQAETAWQTADSAAGMARVRLKKAKIVSPFAGQVARRNIQPGDVLAPGQPAFEVVDNRKMEIQADLPAGAIASVKPGQAIRFRIAGFPDPFEGKVAQVSPSLGQDGRTLKVRMEVPNPDRLLKSGLFVDGEILAEGAQSLPALPATLLKVQGQAGKVFLAKAGVAREAAITLGGEQDGWRAVRGLAAGDEVIAEGRDLVHEGVRLRVIATGSGRK
ncbi:MAG: efflux RND transporter periplasmic adaptor subunit [Holophagaceae bacterium]|nr:efflux RND transporter periplasmic adaptor subunit [Holophagaceae bacterium]